MGTKHGSLRAFVATALLSETDDCIDWPFGLSQGYGAITYEGVYERAHVVVCREAHGPRPEGMDAAHSCERRICINPRHLSWQSKRGNRADGLSKVTLEIIELMRRMRNEGLTHAQIGAHVGVHSTTVSRQLRGVYWCRSLPLQKEDCNK